MYTKEQIVEEIKRVAKKLGVKSMKKKDFNQHSTIPSNTLKYYLGSWDRALKEAGLEPENSSDIKGKREPKDSDELLMELTRLYDEYGETPTAALVESKGKYLYKHYSKRWKSLSEAFGLVRQKFQKENNTTQKFGQKEVTPDLREIEQEPQTEKSEKIETDRPLLEEPVDFSDLGETAETVPSNLDNFGELGDLPSHNFDEERDGTEEINLTSAATEEPIDKNRVEEILKGGDKMTESQKIILIPQTIKPKITKKKRKLLGEPIQFRGLKYAPLNERGVAYLFGMISHELGFIIEGLGAESPDCEGKRCLDTAKDQWEQVKIDFEFRSSDFEAHGHSETESDIIICWIHDWNECPLEVLELRSTIKLLG